MPQKISATASSVQYRRPLRNCVGYTREERRVRIGEPALMIIIEVVWLIALELDGFKMTETVCAAAAAVQVSFWMFGHEGGGRPAQRTRDLNSSVLGLDMTPANPRSHYCTVLCSYSLLNDIFFLAVRNRRAGG
jgi:hypothetical protein